MPKGERTHSDLIRAESGRSAQNFVIGKMYKCPVMYLNKSDDGKQRPVVILSIMTEGKNSYGLILGSSTVLKENGRNLIPWKMVIKTPTAKVLTTSYLDFLRFIRTINLKKLSEFYDGNREQVYLSDKTLNDIRTKLDSRLFMSTLSPISMPLNSINWNIYDSDDLVDEKEEKINLKNIFSFLEDNAPQEKKYLLILNKFSLKAANSLVLLLSSHKPSTKYCFTLNSFKENPKINTILYGDLRTVTMIAVDVNCLVNSARVSLSTAEVDFIKAQVKGTISLLNQLPKLENAACSKEWLNSSPPPNVWKTDDNSSDSTLSCSEWPAITTTTSDTFDDKNKMVSISNLDAQKGNFNAASFEKVNNKLLQPAQMWITNKWQVTPVLLQARQSSTSTEMNWELFDATDNIPQTLADVTKSTFDEVQIRDFVKIYDAKQFTLMNNAEVVDTFANASSQCLTKQSVYPKL